jgi:hypothetical protein
MRSICDHAIGLPQGWLQPSLRSQRISSPTGLTAPATPSVTPNPVRTRTRAPGGTSGETTDASTVSFADGAGAAGAFGAASAASSSSVCGSSMGSWSPGWGAARGHARGRLP